MDTNHNTVTILHIRPRDETSRQTAERLAEWTERPVRSVPFLYDLPKHHDILDTLQQDTTTPILVVTPISVRATAALLQFMGITTPVLHYFTLESSESDAVAAVADAVKTWLYQNSTTEKDTLSDNQGSDNQSSGDECFDNERPITVTTAGTVEYLRTFGDKRWYPLIDHTACTGCLECVNFCLFGVYSLTADSLPQVENPDVCRNGCPACARVCPGGAILFPLYPDDVIAGKVADKDTTVLTHDRHDYHQAARLRELHTTTTPPLPLPHDTTRDMTDGVVNDDLDRLIDQTEGLR